MIVVGCIVWSGKGFAAEGEALLGAIAQTQLQINNSSTDWSRVLVTMSLCFVPHAL